MDKHEKLFNLGAQMHFEVMEVIRTYVLLIHNSDDFNDDDFIKMVIILMSFLVSGIIPERFGFEENKELLKAEVYRILSLIGDSAIEIIEQSYTETKSTG